MKNDRDYWIGYFIGIATGLVITILWTAFR